MLNITDRQQLEYRFASLKKIIELIALGAPLFHILNVLISLIEESYSGILGSVLLLDADGEILKTAAAPNLPSGYVESINNLNLQKAVEPFNRVLRDRQSLIISDIESDRLWEGCRDLALNHELKASWLTPIFSSEGRILGIFAIYFSGEYALSPDQQLIETVTNLASIAIERQQTENELRHANSLLEARQESAMDGILHVDENRRIFSYNQPLVEMWEIPAEILLNRDDKPLLNFLASQLKQPQEFQECVEHLYRQQREESCLEIHLKNGKIFDCCSRPILSSSGKYYGRILYFRELTESQVTQEKYRGIFENAIEGIFQTTPQGRYLSANPALAKIYGYDSPEELIARVTDVENQLYVDPNRRQEFVRLLTENDEVSNFERQAYCQDGSIIWVSENCRAVRDREGNLLYYEGTIENISKRKEAEERLLQHVFCDSLTGLLNRAAFLEKLHESLMNFELKPTALFAVLFIDLDRFKVINDSLGHQVGDKLLIEFSCRLKNCIQEMDTLARLSGDEFAVLLEELQDMTEAIEIAESIQTALTLPFDLQQQEVFTSASIGIAFNQAISEQVYNSPEHLLRDASTAMYHAKKSGKACHKVFDSTMQTNFLNRLQLETDLRRAIEREELRLHYQLIVSLLTGQISGFEALVRWQHPRLGLVSPVKFIPLAEETGLIAAIGDWVLREACEQMQLWQAEGLVSNTATMSVNVAGRQFGQLNLVNQVQKILEETGLDASNLRLEVTEGAIMDTVESVRIQLDQLRDLGVQLSIDDFGTGYSSLSRLQTFPIDTLKIDRSFVSELRNYGENMEVVQTIINLALHLGMSAIAEGIETTEQVAILRNLGCHYGQGYLFSKPLNSEDIVNLIAEKPSNFLP